MKYVRTKRLRRRLRRPFIWLIVIVLILIFSGFGYWLTQNNHPKPIVSRANVSIKAAQLVFSASQHPKLHVTLPKHHRSLSELLMPMASADSQPTVDVEYKHGPIDLPTTVTASDGGYDVQLSPDKTVRPGQYVVTVSGTTTDGQPYSTQTTFTWGVLAVNTDQSVYKPGEPVSFSLAVLDSGGHTLCNAPLDLTVTEPNGQQTNVPYNPATQCEGDSYLSVPDYTASYTNTTAPGTYQVSLAIHGTPYQITDSFKVDPTPAFTVQRSGATRFNPNYSYGMHLHVTANQNFKGTAVETLPDPRFVVDDAGGATVTTPGKQVVLSWSVNWQAGHSYDLGYSYHPPRQAPSFFVIAPVKLVASDGSTTYQDGRGWQLAGDSAITKVQEILGDTGGTGAKSFTKSSISTTAGNTLVLIWGCACTGTNGGSLDTGHVNTAGAPVTDSASNTWTIPTLPSTNPPAQIGSSPSSVTSSQSTSYVRNAAAITSITTWEGTSSAFTQGFDLIEVSGIDALAPTFGNNSQVATPGGAGPTWSQTGATLPLTTCDSPTTDELMGQGSWFCSHSPSYIVFTTVFCGKNGYTSSVGGWTDINTITIGGANNQMQPSYQITSASGTYGDAWTTTLQKAGSTTIFAMGQDVSGTNLKQSLFWAK